MPDVKKKERHCSLMSFASNGDMKESMPLNCLREPFLKKSQKKRGRPARYGKEVIEALLYLAKVSDWPCGKRLAVIKMLWLPYSLLNP
jgi:hypothetical protein